MKDYRLRPFSSVGGFIVTIVETSASAGLFSLWTGFPFWGCWGISLAVRLAGASIALAIRGSPVHKIGGPTAGEP